MQRTALQAASFEHPCNSVIITRLSGLNMVATGQEMVWEKKFFKVREKSGNLILSQEKLTF